MIEYTSYLCVKFQTVIFGGVNVNIRKICKGVSLAHHRTSRFKTTTVSLNIAAPLDNHAGERALLIYLLSKTNKEYPTMFSMNRALAGLYGASISSSVSKSGETLILSLNLTCLDDRFTLDSRSITDECIRLLFSCFFEPDITPDGFCQEKVEREKELLIQRIDSENDEKRIFALNRMLEEMCRDEAYSLNKFGKKDVIENANGKILFEEWKKLVFNCPIQINYVGSKSENEVAEIISPYFEKLERKDILELHTEFITQAASSRTVIQKQKVKQGKLVVGMRAGMTYSMDNYAALKVMTAIFGAGTFSKLFMNVREKMSLCYYCSASLINSKGIIAVQSGVETENAQKALDAIRNELAEVRRGNFSDETISQAKMSICDRLWSITDSAADTNSWLKTFFASGEFFTPQQIAGMIEKVSREEIIVAAACVTEDTVFILESEKEGETDD